MWIHVIKDILCIGTKRWLPVWFSRLTSNKIVQFVNPHRYYPTYVKEHYKYSALSLRDNHKGFKTVISLHLIIYEFVSCLLYDMVSFVHSMLYIVNALGSQNWWTKWRQKWINVQRKTYIQKIQKKTSCLAIGFY